MTDADFVRSLDKTDAGRAAPLPRAPGRTTDEGKSSSDQGAAAAPPPARAGAASAAGAEGASTIAGASQPGAAVELVLTWPCGAVIHRFDKVPYDSVEEFVQRMEEGYFEHIGIPRCADPHYSRWLAHYDIVHEDQVLRCGLRFSDLDLPPGAHMKLVRTDIAVPAAGPGVGGTPGQLPPQAQAASTIAGASRPGAAVDPPLGADVDQTADASGPGEEAPVVPSSSATAGGSASRLVPLPSAAAQAADEPDGVPDMPQRPAAHSGALQPAAASSSSSYEVIASGGASETQEEQQQPAQPAANADEAEDSSKTQHGSDGDSEDDGDVTVTLLGLGGNDIFPGVTIQVNRDASLGQLQRRVMDAAGVEPPWFKGKDIVVGHWVHSFDDAYCCFMRSPQVRKHVGANRLLARVVNRWSPYAEAPGSITPCVCVPRARVRTRSAP